MEVGRKMGGGWLEGWMEGPGCGRGGRGWLPGCGGGGRGPNRGGKGVCLAVAVATEEGYWAADVVVAGLRASDCGDSGGSNLGGVGGGELNDDRLSGSRLGRGGGENSDGEGGGRGGIRGGNVRWW
jgi:hypothetical protein